MCYVCFSCVYHFPIITKAFDASRNDPNSKQDQEAIENMDFEDKTVLEKRGYQKFNGVIFA